MQHNKYTYKIPIHYIKIHMHMQIYGNWHTRKMGPRAYNYESQDLKGTKTL